MQRQNYVSNDVEEDVTWGTVPRGTEEHHDKPQRGLLQPQAKLEMETPEYKSAAPPLS